MSRLPEPNEKIKIPICPHCGCMAAAAYSEQEYLIWLCPSSDRPHRTGVINPDWVEIVSPATTPEAATTTKNNLSGPIRKCYCPQVKLHLGESARCEWCAVVTERYRCAQKVRGAVPVLIHVRTEPEKAAISFVAEQFFRLATEIEKGE
jgi:hypothetical protein